MKKVLLRLAILVSAGLGTAPAQTVVRPFPASVLAARTVAISNETGNPQVEKGAKDALPSWRPVQGGGRSPAG